MSKGLREKSSNFLLPTPCSDLVFVLPRRVGELTKHLCVLFLSSGRVAGRYTLRCPRLTNWFAQDAAK